MMMKMIIIIIITQMKMLPSGWGEEDKVLVSCGGGQCDALRRVDCNLCSVVCFYLGQDEREVVEQQSHGNGDGL